VATTIATLNAERWLDEVLLSASVADAGGATLSEDILLPAGLGDVAILSVEIRVTSIDALKAAAALPAGARASIISSDAALTVDVIGSTAFLLTADGANALAGSAYLDPDALVLWRQSEILRVQTPELDSDATPTGDFSILIKAVRVRPIEGAVSPIRLVR